MQSIKPTNVERELAADAFVVSMTDRNGNITYVNRTFLAISGFTEEELLGQPHNIVRDPAMPASIFKMLWQALGRGEEMALYIRSLGKDGSHHWGFSSLVPSHDGAGNVVGYYSVRRKAAPAGVSVIGDLYRVMRDAEARGGIDAGMQVLDRVLAEKGQSYEEFVFGLQTA